MCGYENSVEKLTVIGSITYRLLVILDSGMVFPTNLAGF